MNKKKFIKDLSIDDTLELFELLGDKSYRAKQLFSWIYGKSVNSFDEMTNFSKDLRSYLNENYNFDSLELEERRISKIDGTEKFLFKTYDGEFIESVLLRNHGSDEGRLTICISSQVGCAMGCTFCETGKIGFIRNLSVGEIIDQICQVRKITGLINNNIVFMGMGEPFNNYESVIKASYIINYSYGIHISARKITISTSGLLNIIERYFDEKHPFNLAISMNDTLSEKRMLTMPVEKKYPFQKIADLIRKRKYHNRNRITIEYVMRKDNVSLDDAHRIKKMFNSPNIKINLIPLNPGENEHDKPEQETMKKFIDELSMMNVPLSIRKSLGSDISGACGQLSGKKYKI